VKLVEDWKLLLRKAWSVRLGAFAAVLSGAEAVLPLLSDKFPRGTFAILTFVVVVGAMIARFVSQPRMRK